MVIKQKIWLILTSILIGLLVWQYFVFKIKVNGLNNELLNEQDKYKTILKGQRDSLININNKIIEKSEKRFDSISNLKSKIKYIKYEKTIYIDRSVDDNITILAK